MADMVITPPEFLFYAAWTVLLSERLAENRGGRHGAEGRKMDGVGQSALDIELRGQGRDLVLLHSLLSDRTAFDRIAPRLARERRLVLVNLPGFGASAGVGPGADLLGNGFGGFVAVALAVAHGQRDSNEAAEAIAEEIGARPDARPGQRLGDAVGEILETRPGRRRGAEARQIDQHQAPLAGEAGGDAIEGGAVG